MSDAGSIKVWVLVFVLLFGVGTVALVGIGCAVGANHQTSVCRSRTKGEPA